MKKIKIMIAKVKNAINNVSVKASIKVNIRRDKLLQLRLLTFANI